MMRTSVAALRSSKTDQNEPAHKSMLDSISFIVYNAGAPQGSKRHVGNGRMIESSKRVKPFRSAVEQVAIDAIPVNWDLGREFNVKVDFHFKRPKSHLTSKSTLKPNAPLYPTSRAVGDLDKLQRALLDSLIGYAWYDDSQVIDITACKRYADQDQTIITIDYV